MRQNLLMKLFALGMLGIVSFSAPVLFDKALNFINLYRNGMTVYYAPIYRNKREIFRDFKIEKNKLGLENVTINLEITDKENFTAHTWKIRARYFYIQ